MSAKEGTDANVYYADSSRTDISLVHEWYCAVLENSAVMNIVVVVIECFRVMMVVIECYSMTMFQ